MRNKRIPEYSTWISLKRRYGKLSPDSENSYDYPDIIGASDIVAPPMVYMKPGWYATLQHTVWVCQDLLPKNFSEKKEHTNEGVGDTNSEEYLRVVQRTKVMGHNFMTETTVWDNKQTLLLVSHQTGRFFFAKM